MSNRSGSCSEDAVASSAIQQELQACVAARVKIPDRMTFHYTTSALFRRKDDNDNFNRNHMRIVVDLVGRPLDTFRRTKELVQAILDAIKGM